MIRSAYIAAMLSVAASGSSQAAAWSTTPNTNPSVMVPVGGSDTVELGDTFDQTELGAKDLATLVTIDASTATFSDALVGYTLAQITGHAMASSQRSVGAMPEFTAWTMLIVGFGMVGFDQRSRRQALAA